MRFSAASTSSGVCDQTLGLGTNSTNPTQNVAPTLHRPTLPWYLLARAALTALVYGCFTVGRIRNATRLLEPFTSYSSRLQLTELSSNCISRPWDTTPISSEQYSLKSGTHSPCLSAWIPPCDTLATGDSRLASTDRLGYHFLHCR